MNDLLVDTLLVFDVIRSRVDWARIAAAVYCLALWVVVSLLMARAI